MCIFVPVTVNQMNLAVLRYGGVPTCLRERFLVYISKFSNATTLTVFCPNTVILAYRRLRDMQFYCRIKFSLGFYEFSLDFRKNQFFLVSGFSSWRLARFRAGLCFLINFLHFLRVVISLVSTMNDLLEFFQNVSNRP